MPPWIDLRTPAVNPLGNNLNGYQSSNWINLNAPTVLVDFTSLGVGTPLAAGTLPGGGTYTQAVGAGQTEETWVTSWAAGTLARIAAVANTPKIGQAPNGLVGLRLRQTWTNYVRNSERFDLWTPTGTSVPTANTDVSPDGLTNADTLTDDDAAGYEAESATSGSIPNDGETYRLEVFAKKTAGQTHAAGINWNVSGGTPVARSPRLNTNDGTCVPASGYPNAEAFGGSWWRWQDQLANNSSGNTVVAFQLFPASTTVPLPGADTVAGTGAKVFYGASVTRGKLRRDYQPTVFEATCADCAHTYPASRLVRGGRLRLRARWSPSGAPTDYGSNFRLVDHGAETTYVEFSATDQKLRVVVAGGATEVCAVPVWWPSASLYSTSHPVVEFDLEIGGGVATRIRYRYSTDGGVTWTLPFDPLGGAAGVAQGNVSASGSVGILTGAAAGNVADGWLHEHEAILTAPAWALQWLPTDDASVKAHLRGEAAYVLAGNTVSSIGSQGATAGLGWAQAAGANQPSVATSGGKTYLSFDGSNDCLDGAAASSYAGASAKTVWIVTRIRSVTLNGAASYNNHMLVGDGGAGALWGAYAKVGPLAIGYNWDGTDDGVTASVGLAAWTWLRYRHDGATVYLSVAGGAEVTVASGATSSMAGVLSIGGRASGAWAPIDVQDVIVANSATVGQQAAIDAYCAQRVA